MDMAMVEQVSAEAGVAETAAEFSQLEAAETGQVEFEAGGQPAATGTGEDPAGQVETLESSGCEPESSQAVPQEQEHGQAQAEEVPAWRGASTADKLAYAAQLLGVDADTLLEELLARQEGAADGWQAFSRQMAARADEALTARLAEEFEALCRMVPDITSVDQLPSSVWETAVQQGIPLTDAYLRFWYQEHQKAAEEARRQQQNAGNSTGPLSGVYEPPQVELEMFNRAFWG